MQRSWVGLLAWVVVSLGLAGHAFADVSTERGGSILVFPKVIANGSRDTVIQITNLSNSLVRAHCFYVNAALTNPDQPEGPFNPRLWQEVDFDVILTKQQPTHWLVSQGRNVNPFDGACGTSGQCIGGIDAGDPCTDGFADCESNVCSNTACSDAGFDPGLIPPVVPDFEGELKCVEVDDSGAPLSGNHLKGEALLMVPALTRLETPEGPVFLIGGDASKYNALAILGNENNGDGTLVLGGGQCVGSGASRGAVCSSDDQCGDAAPCATEYNACPDTWIVNHAADGAPNIVLDAVEVPEVMIDLEGNAAGRALARGSRIYTQLTVVPCTQNYETQVPTAVTLQFLTTDEFESQLSVSTTVTCWGNFFFGELGSPGLTFAGTPLPDPMGTMYLQTRIRSASGTPFGALMVAEEFHVGSPSRALVMEAPLQGSAAGSLLPLISFASPAAVNLHIEGERSTPDIVTIPAEQLVP